MATDKMTAAATKQVQDALPDDPGLAGEITSSDAFGALAWRLFQDGRDLTDILDDLDPDDRRFLTVADDPAAYLASRIS